ncbi:MAG: hypothetical protein HN341_06710 [Verrucomicrobia bacterium]|nr:hypothetical protein [Verrucomicrobiota bacterium]
MHKFEHNYQNADGIVEIAKDGLCHRCGACVGVCPVGTLATDKSGYPEIVDSCIDCNICVNACSGIAVDYDGIGKRLFGDAYVNDDPMGVVRNAYVAHAADQAFHRGGASGGVVTQILSFLLESGAIQGAVVVVEDPDDPSLGKGIVARNREDLLRSQQSRYTTSPHLSVLNEIKDDDGRFALVGLPCQIHSLRKRQDMDPRWKKRIPLVIGLFCHYNLPTEVSRQVAAAVTPPGLDVRHVKYRESGEKGWPENTLDLEFSDGSHWHSPYGPAQTFNVLSRVTKLGRCLQCLDATAEFSDLSIADPWIRDEKGQWKYHDSDGWSSITVRTEAGQAAVSDAIAAGALVATEIPVDEIRKGQWQMMMEKREQTAFRISARRLFRLSTPDYPSPLASVSWTTARKEIAFWIMRLVPLIPAIRRLVMRIAFSPFFRRFFVEPRIAARKRNASGSV